jgi:hypothetical protein
MKRDPLQPMRAATRLRSDQLKGLVLGLGRKINVRGVGYLSTATLGWPKTEGMFTFVMRQLGRMRMNGEIPWDRIYDPGSEVHGGDTDTKTYDPEAEVKKHLRDFHGWQISRWADQPVTCQVYLEKDGLAPIIQEVTDVYRVPLVIGGGNPSLTRQRNGYDRLRPGKRNVVLGLFDYDGSGNMMAQDLEDKYTYWNEREQDGKLEIKFVRVALTEKQIAPPPRGWGLPTRPPKTATPTSRHSNPHGKYAGNVLVELDAASPEQLQGALREAIESVIDREAWVAARNREQELTRQTHVVVANMISLYEVNKPDDDEEPDDDV